MRKFSTSVTAITWGLLAVAGPTGCGSETPTAPLAQPSAVSIQVPDVRGERPARAQQILQDAGYTATVDGGTGRATDGSQCVVSEQDPQPGTAQPSGSTVVLRTSGTQSPDGPAATC